MEKLSIIYSLVSFTLINITDLDYFHMLTIIISFLANILLLTYHENIYEKEEGKKVGTGVYIFYFIIGFIAFTNSALLILWFMFKY